MAVKDPTSSSVLALVGSRSTRSGLLWPAAGLQPFYLWLMSTLRHLDDAATPDFLVKADDADAVTVRVMPGRCSNSGTGLAYAGETIGLGAYNNNTALIWLALSGGAATIGTGTSWPGGTHHKLAAVTLASGAITAIVDRRFEKHFAI